LELNHLELCKKSDYDSINFVSRSDYNNGITAFVKRIEDIVPNEANTISVALGGSSVLASFYQPEPYYSGRDLTVLQPLQKMYPAEMIFYAICIKSNRYRYGFGRQANKTLKDIFVPSEMPKEFSNILMEHILTITNKSLIDKTFDLNTSQWKPFKYDKLFDIKKGDRIISEDMRPGKTPCVRAIDSNNGVSDYIDIEPNHSQNTITVNYDGSIAEAFYQPKPYFALDTENILYPKFELNPFIAMFLVTLIKKEKYRFNYGRKWKLERMNESIIKLPVEKNNEPDWQFMENYIKSLPYSSSIY
jgi:hypothetical protein